MNFIDLNIKSIFDLSNFAHFISVWIGYTHQRLNPDEEWKSNLAIVTAGVDEISKTSCDEI